MLLSKKVSLILPVHLQAYLKVKSSPVILIGVTYQSVNTGSILPQTNQNRRKNY